MNEMSFKEEDVKKLVEYLNFINDNAKFDGLKNLQIINYFKLLSYMQNTILPKMEANIVEIKKVIKPKDKEK